MVNEPATPDLETKTFDRLSKKLARRALVAENRE